MCVRVCVCAFESFERDLFRCIAFCVLAFYQPTNLCNFIRFYREREDGDKRYIYGNGC